MPVAIMSVQFFNNLSAAGQNAGEQLGHTHSHDTDAPHSHDLGDEHGHTHEHLEHPGKLDHLPTVQSHGRLHDPSFKGSTRSATYPIIRTGTSMSVVSQSASVGAYSGKGEITSVHGFMNSPVGSGKTALTLVLCQRLRSEYNIGPSVLTGQYRLLMTTIAISQQLSRTTSSLAKTRSS